MQGPHEMPGKKKRTTREQLERLLSKETRAIYIVEADFMRENIESALIQHKTAEGDIVARILIPRGLSGAAKDKAVLRELSVPYEPDKVFEADVDELLDSIDKGSQQASLHIASVVIPEKKVKEGVLIKSASLIWLAIVDELKGDWSKAHQIPPNVWEELVAGAFSKAGFDEVILTPRSGDFGRDVIASTKGVGCIKIIGSVKAYKPGHLVKHDDYQAVLANAARTAERAAIAGMAREACEERLICLSPIGPT